MPRIVVFLLMAAACLMAQDQTTTPPPPPPAIPDLIKTGQAGYMKGDYESARQSFQQAWDIARMGPMDDPVRYDILKRLVSARAAAGEFADADDFLQLAISWREQNLGMNDPKIVDDVLLSVGFARAMKDFDKARLVMGRVLSMHFRKAAGADSIEVADDFSRMGQIYAEMDKKEDAINWLSSALDLRTKILGPLDASLVYDLDRLGGLQIASRAYEKAEATYRHALVIRETLYGKKHADLIATVDGLAYALFGQKKFDDAEPFYLRLLDLWKASVGSETHPMVAMAYDKIAIFYGAQKKWDQAEEATTHANAIRAFQLADGLSGEASQRIDESKLAEALPIYERAIKILDPPNALYDSERADLENMANELKKVVKKPTTQPPPAKKK
ncbi:MAG: tetratricopeptide repeat protein [Bryobacteraceae bacterium]|jgi:tetratricopeptide (TPR) repeat protein